MFQWIARIRASSEHRRKKIFIWTVVVAFVVLVGGWVLAIQFGFVDMQASWLSGTHTYSASGTPESTDLSPLRNEWDQAKDALGNAWNNLGSVLQGSAPTTASGTPLVPLASSTTKTASTTTTTTNSL